MPAAVWEYFSEICKIPRPSKKEDRIRKYLLDFSGKHGLESTTDIAGNVLIKKKAVKGMENRETVILQAHLDMVCEKDSNSDHDFNNDEIVTVIEGEWMKASGTTLGADDGIGIAAMLAVLVSDDLKHGPLECLFTVDEESGLTGAQQLETGFMSGKILINLDSEDEGEIFIGCAGGIDTLATFTCKPKGIPSDHTACEISVKGLKGGHSGDDIHIITGNSIIILTRILIHATERFNIRLSRFDGGNLRNAIPREALAIFTIHADYFVDFKIWWLKIIEDIKDEYALREPGMEINLKLSDHPQNVINKKTQLNLLHSLYACPNGVIDWSKEIEGMVETSTNLASVKSGGKHEIIVTTSQRSAIESAKLNIASRIKSVFTLAGASVTHSTGYPGWKPDKSSNILRIATETHKELFNTDPKIKAVHAGLECGLFLEKYPYLDMISIGPTIKGAHSPDERIQISSVSRFWKLLTGIMERIPVK